MAIIFLGQKDNSAGKQDSVEAQQGQIPKFNHKRERTYLLISDTIGQTEDDILADGNIPALGNSIALGYPVKEREATCVGRLARHPVTGVPCELWEVTCSADSALTSSEPNEEDDPLNLAPLIEWEWEDEEVAFEYDMVTGAPVVNPNNEPYFDKRTVIYPVLCITRYEEYPVFPDALGPYINTLNASPFWGTPPKTCLMKAPEISVEEVESTGFRYSKIKYRIAIKYNDYYASEPWKARYLCQGQQVRMAPGKPPITNKPDGNPVTINLSASTIAPEGGGDPIGWPGGPLPEGVSPQYQEFNKYKPAEWYPLDLHVEDDYPDGPPPEEEP